MNKLFSCFLICLFGANTLTAAYHSDSRYGQRPYVEPQYIQRQQQQQCQEQQQSCDWSCPPKCNGKLSFSADYLYWRACTDGVAFALLQKKEGTTQKMIKKDGVVGDGLEAYAYISADFAEKLKFSDEWKSGLRLGLGFQPYCTCLDFALSWTYYEPDGSSKVKAKDGYTVVPFPGYVLEETLATEYVKSFYKDGQLCSLFDFYVPFLGLINGNDVHAHSRMCLNLADLELGYNLHCDECVLFRPHFGLRYASIEQTLRLKVKGTIDAFMSNPPGSGFPPEPCAEFTSSKTLKSSFHGVGPRIGFDSEVRFTCFCLYGDFAVSLLYGDRDTHHKESADRLNAVEEKYGHFTATDFKFKRSSSRCCTQVVTDTEVGICWNWTCCYCNNNFDFGLNLGWQHHYFFNQSVADAARNSPLFAEERVDLSTQGLVVGLTLGF